MTPLNKFIIKNFFFLLKCLQHLVLHFVSFIIVYKYIVTFEGLSDLIHSRDFFKEFSQDSDASAHEHSLPCHSTTIRSIGIVLWDAVTLKRWTIYPCSTSWLRLPLFVKIFHHPSSFLTWQVPQSQAKGKKIYKEHAFTSANCSNGLPQSILSPFSHTSQISLCHKKGLLLHQSPSISVISLFGCLLSRDARTPSTS